MTQRKCGTCRYFEEGGIAASGWCRHPERQELQHMVLVRKTELACRDGWDHDLWEPKDGSGSGNGTGPAPTRGGEQLDAGRGSFATGGRTQRFGDGPEASIGLSERLTGGAGTAVGEREGNESSRRSQSGSVFETEWSPFDTPSLPFDRAREREPVDEIRDETFSTRGLRISAEPLGSAGGTGENSRGDDQESPQGERNGARSTDRDDLNPFKRPGPDSPGQFGAPRYDFPAGGQRSPESVEPGRYEPEPVEQSGLTEPFDVMDDGPGVQEPVREPAKGEIEPEVNGEDVMDPADSHLDTDDDGNRVSLNIPMSLQREQCCRTCRDFRPAEGGQQGWCNNPYAFEQRQRVDADDLACHGTFGNWWSPADDWWIERADISHHSTPTPLVDELIREGHEQSDQHQRSTGKHKSS